MIDTPFRLIPLDTKVLEGVKKQKILIYYNNSFNINISNFQYDYEISNALEAYQKTIDSLANEPNVKEFESQRKAITLYGKEGFSTYATFYMGNEPQVYEGLILLEDKQAWIIQIMYLDSDENAKIVKKIFDSIQYN